MDEMNYYKGELAKLTASKGEKEEPVSKEEDLTSFINPLCKYVIWAAINNEGPYKNEVQIPQILFEEDYALFPNGYIGSDELHFMTTEERQAFRESRVNVKDMARYMAERLKEIEKHKCDFLREIHSLGALLQQEVFSKMSIETANEFKNWVVNVINYITVLEDI